MANTDIKRRWIEGVNERGKKLYFNLNAADGIEQCAEDSYVVYIGGGDRVFLTGCTFRNNYPDFVDVED